MPNYSRTGLKISGKTKFKLFSSNHHQYIQRMSEEKYNSEYCECPQVSVEHNGHTVMFWGCISASGKKKSTIRFSTKQYQLKIGWLATASFSAWKWSQIHCLKHACIEKHSGRLLVIDWSLQNLAFNITETVCDHLGIKWNRRQPTSKEEAERPSERLENYCWRLLKEITRV